MKARVALALPLAAVVAGCGSQSAGDTAAGGLYGKVVIRPATPVCRVGADCSRPASGITLVFSRHGRRAASRRTDRRGRYRIQLQAGNYAVRVAGMHRRGSGLRPHKAAAPPGGRFARVTFTYDPGIR